MKPNILCIEDHPDNMTLVKRIFRSDSYNLIEAWNGYQGLSLAENREIDLNHTPIAAITANAMKGDIEKALKAGCDRYMSKPINIVELAETADVLIAHHI